MLPPPTSCLYALQLHDPASDALSSLHRCLQRHGDLSVAARSKAQPPPNANSRPIRSASFISTSPRFELRKASSTCSSPSTERRSSPSIEMHEKVTRRTAGDFLRRLIAAVPYRVHTVLTDNGTHFTTPGNTSSAAPDIKAALEAGELVWAHAFEYACAQNDIDHRLTKPKHPWTNGQVERMNRTIKDATVKRYFYETHDQLRAHLQNFVDAYNFARRLKTLRGLTPYEFICKAWTSDPHRFKISPLQQMPGLNS